MEGGGLMGNDGGGKQWWGFLEGEGMVCCASHFVRGPSIFVRVEFSFVCSHFHLCMVVFAHAQSSSSFEWSWGSFCPWALVVHGWAHCCPWVEGDPWGVIIIQGQVSPSMGGASSSAGGALPSVGGARHCLWMVGLVTCCGLSVKVDIAWVVGIHESGGHGVGVRVQYFTVPHLFLWNSTGIGLESSRIRVRNHI